MPFGYSDFFTIERPTSSWSNSWNDAESWKHDEALKRAFGAELLRHQKPFQAALALIADTGQALWASVHWLADPVVLASKEAAHNANAGANLLDKEALAAKLLEFANEKDPSQRFYVVEAKDRLAAYKLYAEIQGFIGNKIDINASTNTINNLMQIKFVKPEPQEEKTEASSDDQTEAKLPINLKLVSAR